MSQREKVCASRWLEAALAEDLEEEADRWKEEGLKARLARIAPGEEMTEPPIPEYRRPKRRRDPTDVCDLCRDLKCRNYQCLL